MSFTPSDEEIKGLAEQARKDVAHIKENFDTRLNTWFTAYSDLGLAFGDAYDRYNPALKASQKRKSMMVDVAFVALTGIVGKGFEIFQSALMQDSLQFDADCKKLFGDVFEWGMEHLGSTIGGKISEPKTYKAPHLLINTEPHYFIEKLKNILFHHRDDVDVPLQELINRLKCVADGDYQGEDTKKKLFELIAQNGHYRTIDEARNLFRWIFNAELNSNLLGASSYFANSPNLPSNEELMDRIERCMWAETFRVSDIVPPKWLPQGFDFTPTDYGWEFIRQVLYKPGSPVEKRLVALGIMAPSRMLQKAAQQRYSLNNFGHYTDDMELAQLKSWATSYTPEYIGGPMDPSRKITSPQVWKNFKLRAYAK